MKIPENWTFKNKAIANDFDDHVREQLPWYDLCTEAVEHIARQYLPENGKVYDIGCSTGNIYKALSLLLADRNATYIGIDNSQDMLDKFSFSGDVVLADAFDYDYKEFDVAICFLTMLFIPYSRHDAFLKKLTSKINKGGCLIVVDKCLPKNGYVSTVLSRLALREKLKTTSPDKILKKELSLSGIQRPIKEADFCSIGVEFFRFGDFAGWIIENA